MKRQVSFAFLLCCILGFVSSCEKAPFLVLNSPNSLNFTDQGGSQIVSFSVNRDWTVSSSDSWCKVSPSSGLKSEGELSFTITCDPNTAYDPRNATVTIRAEELMESITVTQDTNLGMLVSQTSYSVSSAEQALEVEVKANVNYVVDIPSDCKDWISHISTKSLTSRTLVLKISENKAYDDRTGHVTIRQTDGPLAETITINQKQAEGIVVPTSEYRVSRESQTLEIEIESNVDYEVIPEVEWIQYIETKALTSSSIVLFVDESFDLVSRVGSIIVKSSRLEKRIKVNQGPDVAIEFEDSNTKRLCVQNWDKNGDGELSINEAKKVSSLGDVFEGSNISSFIELRFFKGIDTINNSAFKNCDVLASISISNSVTTIGDSAFMGCTSLKIIEIPDSVTSIGYYAFNSCTSLTGIEIPDSVTNIRNGAFFMCVNLTSIEIPDGVTNIGGDAFAWCQNLASIEIPDSVTSIGPDAFWRCTSLNYIVVNAIIPPMGDTRMFNITNDCPIYVPAESVAAYKAAQYWSDYSDRITRTAYGFWVVDKLDVEVSTTVNGNTTKRTSTTDFSQDYCRLNLDISGIATLWFNELFDLESFVYDKGAKSITFNESLNTSDNGKAIVLFGLCDAIIDGDTMVLKQPESSINTSVFGITERATYYLHSAPDTEHPREIEY